MGSGDHGRHTDHRSDPVDAAGAEVIAFDVFRIDSARRCLMRDGVRMRIQQKPLDVLTYLARNRARVVPREELLERFWPRAVNEEALTRCISTIRRRLGDVRDPPRYIETLWGRGYRFIAAAEQAAEAARPPHDSMPVNAVENPDSSRPSRNGVGAGFTAASRSDAAGAIWRWPRHLALGAIAIALVLGSGFIFFSELTEQPAGPAVQGLAVVPMAAGTGTEDWFAAALTDRLVETVSRIEGVRVVTQQSAAQFSARSDPAEIGRQLDVDAVLLTHLEQDGDRMLLRAMLVSTSDGSILWSFSTAPAVDEIDDNQVRQLARSVAKRLWANLQLREPDRLVDRRAYQHYLRGRYYWNQRSGVALAAAIQNYEAALKLEPNYVDALLGLADSWLVMPLYLAVQPNEAFPEAREAAQRALELDPGAAHAHAVLGVIAMQYDWDWGEAEAHLRRALTLNPNDATAEQWLGELHCYRLRKAECLEHLRAASGLDPLSPVLRMMRGSPALFSGDFRAAVAAYSAAIAEVPEFPLLHYSLGLAYAGLEEWDRAIESYEASLPNLGLAVVGGPMAYALARRGATAEARALVADLERLADSEYVPPMKIAIGWLGLGERDRALEWLERALDVRDDRLVYLAVDVHFLELHDDLDFQAYARRVGLLDVLETRAMLAQQTRALPPSGGGEDAEGRQAH